MTNPYYSPSGNPATGSEGLSSLMRSEFATLSAAFDLLPAFTANGGKAVVVNPGGTALTVTVGTLALAGNLSTTGAFNTIFAQSASVTLTLPGVNGTLALLASPAFTGTPTASTAAPGTNTTQLATTAFDTAAVLVETNRATTAEALLAPKASPALTGTPTAPTAAPGTNTTQLATTAFDTAAVAVETSRATTAEALLAPKASPTFTGTPLAPTAAPGTNTTQLATTAFDTAAVAVETSRATTAEALLAPKASPALTGTPTVPTAAPGTNTTQAASTAFSAAAVLVETTARIAAERGALGGMRLSNDGGTPNTVLDISAGTCTDSTNAATITLGAFTKTTGGVWVSGTGNAGMGTGLTIANATWYHVFAVVVSGVADVYFDTSVTAANKPASTTAFRRIGSFLTNGSAQIIAFSQNGDEFLWATTVLDLSTAVVVTTAFSVKLTVPFGLAVNALFRAGWNDTVSSSGIIFTSLSENDQVPASAGSGLSLSSPQAAPVYASFGQFNIRSDGASNIRARAASISGSVAINTYGWLDTRGRFV